MPASSSASHGEGEAWFPLVVDCGVCQTTHALAVGDRRGCPFEGSQRALPAPSRRPPVTVSDNTAVTRDRLTSRFLR